jgi:hypothetical protein
MAELIDAPTALATTPPPADPLAERLKTLEDALARLQRQLPAALGSAPEGLAAGTDPAHSDRPLLTDSLTGVIVPGLFSRSGDGTGFWGRIPVLHEFGLMFKMYVDPRYRLSRVAQFGVPLVLGVMLLNYITFAFFFAIPVAGLIFERVGLIVLSIVLYKILSREAARYAAVLEYLTRYAR